MFETYRTASRRNWGSDASEKLTLEQINTGAILRIADAAENMAKSHADLIRERNFYEKECERLRGIRAKLERSNAALRGHLKRAKLSKLGVPLK